MFEQGTRCAGVKSLIIAKIANSREVGAGSEFGLWHCRAGQLYWFLTKNSPQGTTQPKANALALCRDWVAPVPEIIEGTPENAIPQNDIVDRPPLRWWGRARLRCWEMRHTPLLPISVKGLARRWRMLSFWHAA